MVGVHESLGEIRRIIEGLVARRDERRDGFAKVIGKAMKEKLGEDADEALKALLKNGISRGTAKRALEIAERQGRFTIFALVDALTRIAGEITLAGDRSSGIIAGVIESTSTEMETGGLREAFRPPRGPMRKPSGHGS